MDVLNWVFLLGILILGFIYIYESFCKMDEEIFFVFYFYYGMVLVSEEVMMVDVKVMIENNIKNVMFDKLLCWEVFDF